MAKKLDYMALSAEINTFTAATNKIFGSHSYAAGALGSQLAATVATLPAYKQQEVIDILKRLVAINTKA